MASTRASLTNVLYRSQIEIARVLRLLEREGSMVSAHVANGERLYITRVVHVDLDAGYFLIAFSDEKQANDALLGDETVVFRGNVRQTRVEFSASHPCDTVHDDKPAIRFAFPSVLAQIQRRRFPRYRVPGDVSLRCVADSGGVMPFEARISDISLGGLGAIVYDAGIRLPPGTVLIDCRIVVPEHEPVLVDIEVCYTKPVQLDDGALANRSGVRFVRPEKQVEALVKIFVVDLENEN
ncbi:MAG: hypothetical protein A3G25_09010 [Betaproteobacteria bacterium RIFCSPLOWO2_12_FULL_63_13]|nr:MAG: hypothetical protein A3G25_09010 [Betaproteobacteria bacterium RIFCSPLOWO2_12_FULL_63_13]